MDTTPIEAADWHGTWAVIAGCVLAVFSLGMALGVWHRRKRIDINTAMDVVVESWRKGRFR